MKLIISLASCTVIVSIVMAIAYVLIGHKSAYEPQPQRQAKEIPRGFL